MKKNILKKIVAVVLMLTMLTVAFAAQAAETSGASLKKGAKVVTTGREYLRTNPDRTSKAKVVVAPNTVLTLLSNSKRDERGVAWYNVKYDGKTGWISSRYAKKYSSNHTNFKLKTLGGANLFSEPDADSTVLKTIPKHNGMTYLNVETEDAQGRVFYKVKFKGTTGWVAAKSVYWQYV